MRDLTALIPYFRPYARTMALGLGLVVVSNGFALLGPIYLGRGVDALAGGGSLAEVTRAAVMLVTVAVVGGLARWGMREILNGASRRVEYDLRNDLYHHLARLPPAFYSRTPTGDLIALSANDLPAVRMVAGPAIMYLVDTTTRAAIALPLMIGIDWRLTLLALSPLALLPVAMFQFGQRIHRHFTDVQEHFATMTTRAHENISGVRVVRSYRMEEREEQRWAELNATYLAKSIALARVQGLFYPTIGLLGGLGGVAALWLGVTLILRGTITVGDFIAFTAFLAMLVWPMIALGWVTTLFQRGAASLARLMAVLRTEPTIDHPVNPRSLPPASRGRTVEYHDVWFRYPASREGERAWALRGVSFRVPPGGSLAVVGATGAGKSALVELLPRLFDPQRGAIRIDGVDIRELRLEELRATIGFVPQETFLFSDTIASNILFDEPSDRLAWAARVAELDETVQAFPAAFDTLLGERGINLSGGQKQRTAIARALARDPAIVVLDDALSAVDTQTEAKILAGLRDALAGRTSIIVSHRVTAVRDADWIVVLDEGAVVEAGRHADLTAAGGRYWQLLRRQQLEEGLEVEPDAVNPPARA